MTRKLSETNFQSTTLAALSGGGVGTSVYDTLAELPLANNQAGARALVKENSRVYVWNNVGWYNIALINTNPSITVGPDAEYTLATDGTPTEITLAATDPEGVPITWSYAVTSGTLGNTTVTSNGSVFTVTPSTDEADQGDFTLTFTASDGINIDTAAADFILAFVSADQYYNQSVVITTTSANSANNTFLDSSGSNLPVTYNFGVAQGIFSPFFRNDGRYNPETRGGSGFFDGVSGYLTVPANTAFDLGSDNFTIEAWVYQTSAKSVTVFARWPSSGSNTSYLFRIENTGKLGFAYNIGGEFNGTASTSSITYNEWNHVAWVRTGNTIKYFINGVEDQTAPSLVGSFAAANSAPTIGLYNTSVDSYFNGYISDLRVVKGSALYTSTFTVPTAPLSAVANTSLLLNFSNLNIYDETGKVALRTYGTASTSTVATKYGNTSIFINGAGNRLEASNASPLGFGSGDWTFESWVYPVTLETDSLIFDNRSNGLNQGVGLYLRSTTGIAVANNTATTANGGSINLNSWSHVAFARQSGVIRGFINGTQVWSVNDTRTYGAAPNVTIGNGFGLIQAYKGYMSDTRITKGVARYTANFTPPTAKLGYHNAE